MNATLPILHEDNHLLVVNKPAELPTMGVADGRATILTLAKDYLKHKYQKPGNVYVGVVSRLDAPVTGILVLARTSKAAARLSDMLRKGEIEKRYWAIVDDSPEPQADHCSDYLRKSERHRRVEIAAQGDPQSQLARLTYRTIRRTAGGCLLEIELLTGRKHQIRVQLAARGWPVRGDRKYGSRSPFPRGIALHSAELRMMHPVRRQPLDICCEPPEYWPRALRSGS